MPPTATLSGRRPRRRAVYSEGVPTASEVHPDGHRQIDPVCGMEVDTATSLLFFEYEGTTYWFCGKGCLLEFKDDPAKYLADGLRQPSM